MKQKMTSMIKKNLGGWLIMLPSIFLFLFFIWIPLFSNVSLSFYDTVGYTKETFVGLEKYEAVLTDPLFTKALLNTLLYTFWSVVIGFLVPIILAIILSEVVHLKGLFRTGIYFPNIVPGLATVIMWTFLMSPESGGVLNSLLSLFKIEPQRWLDSPTMVIPLIVITMTWKGFGATTLIYLATIQSIDSVYYEAARVEGASVWQRIRHVTIPNLSPLIRMLFILQIISVFQVFYEPLVMTSGGPNNASISLLQLVHRYVFRYGDASKAAALGVIVASMLFILTFVYLKLSKNADNT
ncbi:MAG: ABC-type transporter, integral rane subunit [Haloplasmataceae bacterium]|jgi:multiple sugar transport system permease protein|nr:ABC-type transporter, integral rane subunit [Haloplasmataceae bacterium]